MGSVLGRDCVGLRHVLGQLPVSVCGAKALGFLFLSRTATAEGMSGKQSGREDLPS